VYLTKKYSRSFQTWHKQDDGSFIYVPVGHKVVARYMGFMQRIGLLQNDALVLSPRGKSLAWESRGNELLLEAVDDAGRIGKCNSTRATKSSDTDQT
jgi:hypothetical protein